MQTMTVRTERNITKFMDFKSMRNHDTRDPATMERERLVKKANGKENYFLIDLSKSHLNVELVPEINLKDFIYKELEKSIKRYDSALAAKNEKHSKRYKLYDKAGNPKYASEEEKEKILDEEFKKATNSNTREETCLCVPFLLEIGNKDHIFDGDLETIGKDYIKAFEEKYGMKVISATLHKDETNPHIHMYAVPIYKSKDLAQIRGKKHIGLDIGIGLAGALECAGFTNEKMDLEKNDGTTIKVLNRKEGARAQFSTDTKELFVEVCKIHNVEVGFEKGAGGKHLSIDDYKERQDELNAIDKLKDEHEDLDIELIEKNRQINNKEKTIKNQDDKIQSNEIIIDKQQNLIQQQEHQIQRNKNYLQKLSEMLDTIVQKFMDCQTKINHLLDQFIRIDKRKYRLIYDRAQPLIEQGETYNANITNNLAHGYFPDNADVNGFKKVNDEIEGIYDEYKDEIEEMDEPDDDFDLF